MESKPTVSVVLICYNHEEYINEAINSILSQTFSDFELIIVDDGSSDDTLRIIQGFRDPRILIVEQENYGPSSALNAGIDKCCGNYIAFMSGDDISYPHRLASQIKQLELHNADIIFCLPQIIGPHSELLAEEACPWFFGREFENTAELYSQLFFYGNFLCAPSGFCRRTTLVKVGRFKQGLMQLQDFDYWIRVCKKNLVVKLFKDPLVQYRYLYGLNLSDKANLNRVKVENLGIYRSFFDEAPIELISDAFTDRVSSDTLKNAVDVEIEKSFFLLDHPDMTVKAIGAERIIGQLEEDEIYKRLIYNRSFGMTEFFRRTNAINLDEFYDVSKSQRIYGFIRTTISDFLKVGLTSGPILKDTQMTRILDDYLEHDEYDKAMRLIRVGRFLRPEASIKATLHSVFSRILRILAKVYAKTKEFMEEKFQAPDYKVFKLAKMYDYSKQANLVNYDDLPEQVYIKQPRVIGVNSCHLHEGIAICPRPYNSILNDAVITGGSCIVISQEGLLLSDELVDFEGDEYGIKSPYVKHRYKDKVILGYQKRPKHMIKEGILLSCDHDANYFHWIVECLPKLILIDSLKQFKDAPLLIPKGLHVNLEAALEKVNINNRHLIRIDAGVAYQVNRLIFPSALSRVVDRYKGEVSFNTDIVLSHKWISLVADQLQAGMQQIKKPWRKIFITRRKGLRVIPNLAELEIMLLKQGFECIELDNRSLEFQMELFSQAAIVVAPTGAALTNMLFCQPGTKVIGLMSNHELTNFYFWSQLGDIAGVEVQIIAGERLYNRTDYYSVHDDYTIDPKILQEELRNITQRE